ncbi:MAG: hypothetical protein HOE62_04040 [Alphaproteobacteria bacterium]|jgi:hypothetical protein|nr:hypothetical protein [Alphaproteobacteria bacterium]MBT4017094.1 hypothetical protein [Alphaproteobacteria bacterium]MBT4546056.1 hypothetical protein [Alphaproteobacteria bacterium]MBT7745074.1 hypothetical protein [Alphaproteobacteria bacterium]
MNTPDGHARVSTSEATYNAKTNTLLTDLIRLVARQAARETANKFSPPSSGTSKPSADEDTCND